MATNLELNDDLIKEAMQWGKHKTKRAAVTAALEFYIELKNRQLKELKHSAVKAKKKRLVRE